MYSLRRCILILSRTVRALDALRVGGLWCGMLLACQGDLPKRPTKLEVDVLMLPFAASGMLHQQFLGKVLHHQPPPDWHTMLGASTSSNNWTKDDLNWTRCVKVWLYNVYTRGKDDLDTKKRQDKETKDEDEDEDDQIPLHQVPQADVTQREAIHWKKDEVSIKLTLSLRGVREKIFSAKLHEVLATKRLPETSPNAASGSALRIKYIEQLDKINFFPSFNLGRYLVQRQYQACLPAGQALLLVIDLAVLPNQMAALFADPSALGVEIRLYDKKGHRIGSSNKSINQQLRVPLA